jgi:thiamine-phosphate pyrophosphorylase
MKQISKIQYITQSQSENDILEEVYSVLNAGVNWVQLRIKDDSLDFLVIAKQVKALTDKHQATLIINDNVDVVKQIDADGVHVGLTDMPIQKVREVIGFDKIIGGTANTIVDCKNIEFYGADYIGLGPFRATLTKKKLSPILGIEGYKSIIPKNTAYGWDILNFNIPIVAIGGLRVDDIKLLKQQTGVYGVALSSLIYQSTNKKVLVDELKNILY